MAAADRLVGGEVLAWSAVTVVGCAGLAWLMGSVERVSAGGHALALAALRVPEALIPLVPLLAGLGAALAASRLEARGERVALEASGWGPWRTGLPALAVGLALGLTAQLAADQLVPRASAAAARLEGRPPAAWVWLDGAAVRLSDGLRVRASEGRISQVDHASEAERGAPEVAAAAAVQRPRSASGAALAGVDLAPAVVERHARSARALAAAGLALLGWWPWSRRAGAQIGAALSVGLGWQVLDFLLQSFAAQGRIPSVLGAYAAPLGLILVGLGLIARDRRISVR